MPLIALSGPFIAWLAKRLADATSINVRSENEENVHVANTNVVDVPVRCIFPGICFLKSGRTPVATAGSALLVISGAGA